MQRKIYCYISVPSTFGEFGILPTNNGFETGNFTGWTVASAATISNTRTFFAQLKVLGSIISSPFTVDAAAQQISYDVGFLASGTNFWLYR